MRRTPASQSPNMSRARLECLRDKVIHEIRLAGPERT